MGHIGLFGRSVLAHVPYVWHLCLCEVNHHGGHTPWGFIFAGLSLTAEDFYGASCFPVSEREAACTWLSLHSSVLSRLRQSNRPTHPLINISQHCESAAAPPHILDFRFKDMKKLRCNTCSTKTRVYYSLDRLISTFTLSTVLRYFYYWCFTWKFKYICLNISILCLKKKEKSTLKKSF